MNNRIKTIRKSEGLTQEEFGKRLGIKRNTVATYEIGRSQPIDAVVSLICREFGISETWLRTGEGEMKTPVNPDDRYFSNIAKLQRTDDETIMRWVNAIAETSPDVLKVVESFMMKILEDQDEKKGH